jgi:ATP-dependent HslUV protease, peptidase subunit HslV
LTTIVVVRKQDRIAIAADSLTTFGDTRMPHAYESGSKIFTIGGSFVGVAGTSAHFPVLRSALGRLGGDCRLESRDDVFLTFSRVHVMLKEHYFLNTKEEDDDPYESSQIMAVIANSSGIYGVYSYREVFEFERFWGIGSGRNFALGAMHALYDTPATCLEIARAGVVAGAEFDKNTSAPFEIYEFALAQGPTDLESEGTES